VRYGEPLYDARMRASRGCRVGGTKIEVLPTGTDEGAEEKPEQDTADATGAPDALRMFGILVPQELRMARGEAVMLVEDLVPRLVMTDLEMREVEVRIRRARKWMAKAEAKGEGKGLERRVESLAVSSDVHKEI
jgi:coiled-coil domain-containing protein 115